MVSYLSKIIEFRDQLVVIGTIVENQELVAIPLNGLVASWRPLVQGVRAREKLSSFTKI